MRRITLATAFAAIVAVLTVVVYEAWWRWWDSPVGPFTISKCREWVWHNPLPQGNILWAVWGSAPDDAIAVGGLGTIIRWDGVAWTQEPSGTQEEMFGVWGSASDNVYAVGGTVLHHDGSGWSEGPQWTETLFGIDGRGPDEIWAISRTDFLRLDGNAWTAIPAISYTGEVLVDVWVGPSSVYAAGSRGNLFRYDGTTVTSQAVAPGRTLRAVWGRADDDLWAAADTGVLYHFDGSSWTEVPRGSSDGLSDVTGDANRVYAIETDGTMFAFNGSWSAIEGWPVSNSGIAQSYAAWPASSGELFVVGGSGMAARWDGTAWHPDVGHDPGTTLHDVWGPKPNEVYAVGLNLFWRYDGNGWTPAAVGTFPGMNLRFNGVWGIGDELWLATNRGLYHRVGGAWSGLSIPDVPGRPSLEWLAIWGSGADDVFAVSDDGKLARFDGTSWSSQALADVALRDVWGRSASDVFVVGDEGQILHFDGAAWSTEAGGTDLDLYGVHGVANAVFAVGAEGTILRNQGAGWQTMTADTDARLRGVWARNENDAYAVGLSVMLQLDATGWNTQSIPTRGVLNAVWGSEQEVFTVGSGGKILAADLCARFN